MPSSSSSTFSFDGTNKVVVVTGGNRGIGAGIVRAFTTPSTSNTHGDDGNRHNNRPVKRCYVVARSVEDDDVEDERVRASRVIHVKCDLSTAEGAEKVKRVVERVDGDHGVDVLVHNSGTSWGSELETHSDDGFRKTYELNVVGTFRLTRALLGALTRASKPEDPSRVIIIGSIAGISPQTYPTFSYDASKAALHHLAKKLADEFAMKRKLNITVNVVAPGYVPTKMSNQLSKYGDSSDDIVRNGVPMRRAGTPADVAGAVAFFASTASSWVTGVVLPVDGGFLAKL
jgi:NAD(P)-dependent dehydrogenase (short-subunit alcohol dehydrogenase family)